MKKLLFLGKEFQSLRKNKYNVHNCAQFQISLYTILIITQIRGRNGFDGVESGGECKQVRYDHNSSKTIIANNNYHYESARLAA